MKESETNRSVLPSRIRFSIAAQLNLNLWLKLLGTFLILDIILVITIAAMTIHHAENLAADLSPYWQDVAALDGDTAYWLNLAGITVEQLTREPRGFVPPASVRKHLPAATAAASRRFIVLPSPGVGSWDLWNKWVTQVRYCLEFSQDGQTYAVIIALDPVAKVSFALLAVLLVFELITLVDSVFTYAQDIRKTLAPLTELARQAQSLNLDRGPLSIEEMQELAGKLEAINAAKLDTRIDVEQTHDELKNLAVAINSLLDRINEAYRSQARFVSDASHELRTPIAAIQGYINLLDRWGKNDPKVLQESIDAIKEEAANMKELIEQLLFLARGDNNRMPLQIEHFDLAEVARSVLKEMEIMGSGHNLEAQLEPVYVNADVALIKQALRILMDNAVKYTPPGGNIKVTVCRKEGKAYLTVQDDGIGIPPEAVPRIFDRFFRADESRARATGGTGLGLSIAKWITERHGGYMEVLSRENLGTRISIILPGV